MQNKGRLGNLKKSRAFHYFRNWGLQINSNKYKESKIPKSKQLNKYFYKDYFILFKIKISARFAGTFSFKSELLKRWLNFFCLKS